MVSNEAERNNFPEIEWNWEQANYLAEWHEPIYELMARYVPEGSKVLEVGAGGSHTIGAIAGRLKCMAFGVEPDEGGIDKTNELANRESAKVAMVRGDGFCIPFADNEFDVVYSLGLIEHFDTVQSSALVREHVRVCKSAGQIVLAVPNFLNVPHTFRKWKLGSRYEYYPERSYTPSALRRLMTANEMVVEDVDGVSPLWGIAMASWGWRPMAVLEKLGISEKLRGLRSPKLRAGLGYMTYAIGRKIGPK